MSLYADNKAVSFERTSFQRNHMLTELPLIMAGGTFKSLGSMNESQLEKFLSYLVRFTCQKNRQSPFSTPPWWSENVTYPPEFHIGQIPLPYTRNKAVKLKRLIRMCYIYNNCKDLLILSEKLASLHALSYKFVRNRDGTVTVMQVSAKAPIVMIPSSNLDYDLDINTNSYLPEISIISFRKSLIEYDTKPKQNIIHEDDSNYVIIEDSSSDDDVQIVSYEKGAFPPTPPRKKLPLELRPGPACSKVRFNSDRPSESSELSIVQLPSLKSKTRSLFSPDQNVRRDHKQSPIVFPNQQNSLLSQKLKQPLQKTETSFGLKTFTPKPLDTCGSVPNPLLQPAAQFRNASNNHLRIRRNLRPLRSQTYTFVDIDLTIDDDDDDDPEKKSCHPSELSKNTFLSRFGLCGKDNNSTENTSAPVIMEKSNKMFNLKSLSLDMVPFLVRMGVLPKRCLCTQQELDQRTNFIEKFTRKDFECSRVTVKIHDKAAIAAVTKKCSVRIKRLNTADMRKWRKTRTTTP